MWFARRSAAEIACFEREGVVCVNGDDEEGRKCIMGSPVASHFEMHSNLLVCESHGGRRKWHPLLHLIFSPSNVPASCRIHHFGPLHPQTMSLIRRIMLTATDPPAASVRQ